MNPSPKNNPKMSPSPTWDGKIMAANPLWKRRDLQKPGTSTAQFAIANDLVVIEGLKDCWAIAAMGIWILGT